MFSILAPKPITLNYNNELRDDYQRLGYKNIYTQNLSNLISHQLNLCSRLYIIIIKLYLYGTSHTDSSTKCLTKK